MPHRNVAKTEQACGIFRRETAAAETLRPPSTAQEAQVDPDPRTQRPAVLLLQTSR